MCLILCWKAVNIVLFCKKYSLRPYLSNFNCYISSSPSKFLAKNREAVNDINNTKYVHVHSEHEGEVNWA